ncbi:MAG TPA: hypothetical protein ENH82_10840, partial [bacterium]|nr:hypothetical protein [bacterium]
MLKNLERSSKLFMIKCIPVFCLALMMIFNAYDAMCSDWPMWRYDAGRTAVSPDNLPDELNLLWMRQYSPRTMVWDDPLNQDLMPYDRVFEPIVMGKTLFLGFNDSDKLVAIDTENGQERWTFYTDGPVRLPSVAWNGKVIFTSDDGCIYCIRADDGILVWKFNGTPYDRKIIGNKRLISTWPARGGPVIKDGIVYFAASIWPFMGIFIYALDAETGKVIWINDSNGSQYMLQPHNAMSFAGVAPQGAFVISEDRLLVPGGRSVPACFDLDTGKFLYYKLASSGKTGGSFVCASGNVFFNHHREKVTTMYDLRTGEPLIQSVGHYPVLNGNTVYFSGSSMTAYNFESIQKSLQGMQINKPEHKELRKNALNNYKDNLLWKIDVNASGDLIKAGNRLYAAGNKRITAIDLSEEKMKPSVAWTKTIDGEVERLVAADNKLFAVTLDGRIMAFGENKRPPVHILDRPAVTEPSSPATQKALSILDQTGVKRGYALYYGAVNGDLLEALVSNSELHIIVVDTDESKVDKLRRRFDTNGLYGTRIAVLKGDPFTLHAPPYMASLTIIDDSILTKNKLNKELLNRIYYSMRPYGGVALISLEGKKQDRFSRMAEKSCLAGLRVVRNDKNILLIRDGPLPGAGEWTHNYGNIANNAKSDDKLVKLPLGILWFGGSSNLDVLPRHGHGPTEQIIGGRLFIEGMNCISARDVYTGRVIWKTMLYDLGNYDVYYDETYRDTPTNTSYNQVHIPGANIRGTNYVATADRLYIIQGSGCHVLDTATGETINVIKLPPDDPEAEESQSPPWGYIGVYDDFLIAGYDFVAFSDLLKKNKSEYSVWGDFDKSASKALIVMDRYNGEILWRIDSRHGFIHNGIAVGNDKIFCIDKLPVKIENQLERRGITPPDTYRLLSLDIKTGDILWEEGNNVFGSFLSYSEEHDIVIQSTRPSRDMVRGEEGNRMNTFRGKDGTPLWDKRFEYETFPIVHGKKIINESGMFSLLDGKPIYQNNPITGELRFRDWKRTHGCNYPIASEHLLTFRSGAAGFFDLDNDGGTGNFGGFRTGCTANLVAADGILNAPDYTRTCSCPYQNQTSLALVHMPEAE